MYKHYTKSFFSEQPSLIDRNRELCFEIDNWITSFLPYATKVMGYVSIDTSIIITVSIWYPYLQQDTIWKGKSLKELNKEEIEDFVENKS